jgi:hypothetical protein
MPQTGRNAGRRRTPRRPAAPRLLDPILTLWERAERRHSHIRPIRRGGVMGVQFSRHKGERVQLADGATVTPGDPVGVLHFDNTRAPEIAGTSWQGRAFSEARLDFQVLATWARRQPPEKRPIAYRGATLVGPIARRVGFEVRPRRRTWRTRLDDWFMRWLMAHWSPLGRSRLERGHGRLRSSDVWLSDRTLQRLYGQDETQS